MLFVYFVTIMNVGYCFWLFGGLDVIFFFSVPVPQIGLGGFGGSVWPLITSAIWWWWTSDGG